MAYSELIPCLHVVAEDARYCVSLYFRHGRRNDPSHLSPRLRRHSINCCGSLACLFRVRGERTAVTYSELISCLRVVAEGARYYCAGPGRPDATRRLTDVLEATRPVLALYIAGYPDIEVACVRILRICGRIDSAIQQRHRKRENRKPGRDPISSLCEGLLESIEVLVPQLMTRSKLRRT